MGAQGAGKGTQAERLAPAFNLYHLSTGDAFRTAIAAKTELGLMAKGFLDRGDLVPDDVTLGIVAAKLDEIAAGSGPERKGGALFDGFPRTASQAEGLTALLADRGESLIAVIEIAVPKAASLPDVWGYLSHQVQSSQGRRTVRPRWNQTHSAGR